MPALLHAFIEARFNIATLLADPRFSSDEIIAFISAPETQSKLADIAKVAHLGLTIRAAEARQTAIATLEEVAKNAEDLVEKRRAASALFRATASPLVPLAAAQPRDKEPAPEKPRPRPVLISHPEIQPRAAAIAVVESLRRVNTPDPNSGYATLAEFCERRISLDGRVVEVSNPDQLRIDLKDTSIAHVPDALHSGPWICDPLPEPGAVQHTERYSVNAKQRRFKLHIHFRRHPPRQPYPETPEPLPPHRSLSRNECWLIHSITTESV